jgi:hypothetical protein
MFAKTYIPLPVKMGKRFIGVLLLVGTTMYAMAATYYTGSGGDKKKDATHKEVPINFMFSNLKNASTLQLSLKTGLQPGLQFTGDFTTPRQKDQNASSVHTLMTFQKGNTIYILPYKECLLLSKFKTPERILR